MKRKSSHHADFSNYERFKRTLNRIGSNASITSLYSSIRDKDHESVSLLKNSIRDASNSCGRDIPEVEFVSDIKQGVGNFQNARLNTGKSGKLKTGRNMEFKLEKAILSFKESTTNLKSSKLSFARPLSSAETKSVVKEPSTDVVKGGSRYSMGAKYNEDLYCQNLESLAKNLLDKFKKKEPKKNNLQVPGVSTAPRKNVKLSLKTMRKGKKKGIEEE